MKYNIGDTVFLKGKVVGVDTTETAYPYRVEFEDGTSDWVSEDDLVEELKEGTE